MCKAQMHAGTKCKLLNDFVSDQVIFHSQNLVIYLSIKAHKLYNILHKDVYTVMKLVFTNSKLQLHKIYCFFDFTRLYFYAK